MFEAKATHRSVKEAFVLAQRMKQGPFDPVGFRKRLAAEQARIRALGDPDLDELLIGRNSYSHRKRCLNCGEWVLRLVVLQACQVWESGLVPTVAAGDDPDSMRYQAHDPSTIPLTLFDLPLIVLCRKSSDNQYRIDDGCHRAVNYYRAGFRKAIAFVGRVSPDLNHGWPWPG